MGVTVARRLCSLRGVVLSVRVCGTIAKAARRATSINAATNMITSNTERRDFPRANCHPGVRRTRTMAYPDKRIAALVFDELFLIQTANDFVEAMPKEHT